MYNFLFVFAIIFQIWHQFRDTSNSKSEAKAFPFLFLLKFNVPSYLSFLKAAAYVYSLIKFYTFLNFYR